MKKTIILLVVFALAGCQTVLEDVAVPAAEVKAVVFYSAGNFSGFSNSLVLTKSKPVLNSNSNGDFETINNAVITLDGGGESIPMLQSGSNYWARVRELNFDAGTEYTLNIETPENGTITSTVTMPDSIENFTLEIDSIDQDFQVVYTGRFSISDDLIVDEYFRVEAFARYSGSDEHMYVETEYFSDENATNGNVNIRFTTYAWDDELGDRPEVYIILSAISQDHYKYGKALESYNPENPFAEPSPLPNNVEGGLGIFTLSNSRVIRIN